MRIDPASVTLQKMRSDGFARIAGVLDYSLSERARIEVEVTASPLADAFAAIAAAGSSLPIAQHVPRIIEHDPHEVLGADALDGEPSAIPLE